MGMLNATGCTSVWGTLSPSTLSLPWSNHLFQDSTSPRHGVYRGPHGEMAEGFKTISRRRAGAGRPVQRGEHEAFFRYFTWEQFSDEEFLLCPPVVAVGGDGAMYDIGAEPVPG